MNKKIMVLCLALLSIVVLSGCSEFPVSTCKPQGDFCASEGMTYKCGDYSGTTFWCKDHHGNKIPYTLEEFNYYNLHKHHNHEHHHAHKEHTKVEHHHTKKKSCKKEMYLDDTKYPACNKWCNKEGKSDEGHSYVYLCHHNCARERTVCTG